MPTETFRSEGAYKRNIAYRHIHNIPMTAERVCIKGKGCHTVKHSTDPKRKKIDAKQRKKVRERKSGR